ncbi:hypothetical protein Tco_0726971 [Tanacetum coccineum]|uniref:Retrotransposon gag domain-containing protein n=1 Tax=Tanacetum coccineum TaxID=301880 RepID=A0ABQ4YI21_9ASTR
MSGNVQEDEVKDDFEELPPKDELGIRTSIQDPPTYLDMKPLLKHLEYAFPEELFLLPVVSCPTRRSYTSKILSQLIAQSEGKVAYRLELPQELSRVHHTFHVSNLKKCYADEPLNRRSNDGSEAGYPWLRLAGTLGEVLSSPGNVKIRSNRNTHNSSQTGLRHPLQEEDDRKRARFRGSTISSGRKKSQRSNSSDGGNTGDGGKTVGGAIGARGSGIGDSLLVALYACMTFIYGSSWKGEMVSEVERSLDESSEGSEEVFPDESAWEENSNLIKEIQASMDAAIFPFTFTETAKRWVDRLAPRTINTWDLLKKAFIQRSDAKFVKDLTSTKLNEEVKQVEKVRYGEFGQTMPFNRNNGGKFRVGPPGYYTKTDNRPPYRERRQNLEELLAKNQEESARRSTEIELWIKKLQENAEINTRNQSTSLKNLEAQIEQLTKEIRSNKALEQVKTITADQETFGLDKIRRVSFILDPENKTSEVLQHQLPHKELNPGNFTLPCTVGKFNFYAIADLGVSINVMPRSMFEHLQLTNLRKTNMLCEMTDMSKKHPWE